MKKTNDIIDLKNCIEGVQIAMSREDYDLAASHIHRYLHIDKSILDPASVELLETAESSLKDIIKLKLGHAMAQDDAEQILRFCKLYPLLGMKQEGIDKYSTHLIKTAHQDEALIYAERDKSLRTFSGEELNIQSFTLELTSHLAHFWFNLQVRLICEAGQKRFLMRRR